MLLNTYCKYITLTGTLVIWAIKWIIRPYIYFSQPMAYILGIAPNLLGAFLLPIGCCWLLNRFVDLRNAYSFKMFLLISFGLLVLNELLQIIPIFGRTFDYGDIAASALGLFASYLFCTNFLFKRIPSYQ